MPACPLARTVTPSHQHLCFPLYRPITSLLSRRDVPILPRCVSRTFLSPPASIRSPIIPPALCTRKRMERNDRWLEMESPKSRRPSLHTTNPSFFSAVIGCAPRSESPSAHGTRSECGWIKLELQRMIGQSFTRLRSFFPRARSLARSQKYSRRTV